MEQPADPDEYLDADNPLYGKVPTFWETPLWKRYRDEAQLWVVTFDQLPLGHPTVKPSGGGSALEVELDGGTRGASRLLCPDGRHIRAFEDA